MYSLLYAYYLVSMTKCDTAVLRGSCECAHDKLTDRDVKLTINGLSGASGTSFYTPAATKKINKLNRFYFDIIL